MLTSRFMRIVSVVGIIALLTLQYVWLRNAYKMVERDIMEKSKDCLKESVDEELVERTQKAKVRITVADKWKISEGSTFERKNVNQMSEINIGLQDMLNSIGFPCSKSRVDSLFQKKVLSRLDFVPEYSLQIISDSVRYKRTQTKNSVHIIKDEIIGDVIYIKIGSNHSLEMVLTSPLNSVIAKAKYIFVISILLAILIGVILVFQLKSMIRDKEFTNFMKDYTRILAHETRTPVNDIFLLTSRLMSNELVDTKKRNIYYQECLNQCSKLLLNIDNILLVAKSERRKLMITKSTVDLRDFIQNILDKYNGNHFLRKDLQIESHYESDNCQAYIDPELMENVIFNLIENAIKYSREALSIVISCKIENKHVIIKIKDNGLGMSENDLKHIFQIFERGAKISSNKIKGFGIGLYYVHKVVKAHKGSVLVTSTEGVGSEFTIDIPNLFQ